MERIVIDVDEGEIDPKTDEYLILLDELRNDMSDKGLTSEELDKILKYEDKDIKN
ncbi:MAG: hypothetical protein WCP85_15310 [Mariniphaga sp.]